MTSIIKVHSLNWASLEEAAWEYTSMCLSFLCPNLGPPRLKWCCQLDGMALRPLGPSFSWWWPTLALLLLTLCIYMLHDQQLICPVRKPRVDFLEVLHWKEILHSFQIFIGKIDAKVEAPILWPPEEKSELIGKDPDNEKDWEQEEKGTIEDETVGWHHQLSGHEFEQTSGDGEGQGSLKHCCLWGCKQSDMTEWQSNNHKPKPSIISTITTAYKWFKLSPNRHLGATAYSRCLIHLL